MPPNGDKLQPISCHKKRMNMNFLDDRIREDYFGEMVDTLDDYLAASSNPQKEYACIILPFFLDCMNHIHSELSHEEKAFLTAIQANWNLEGISDMALMDKLREQIIQYKDTLQFSDKKHRHLNICLEFLTYHYWKTNDELSDVSLTWIFISALLQIQTKIPLDSWLSNELKTRFSRIIKNEKE